MSLSPQQIIDVCKMGQGVDCCRYLICGGNGFECAKTTSLKDIIDTRVNQMNAKSDNCGGVKNE